MKIAFLEGKTSTERNKIIAAGVLGVISLIALYMAFGRGFFDGGSTTTSVKVSTTPRPSPAAGTTSNRTDVVVPSPDEQAFQYETTPVVYVPGRSYAPDPGRNIFAFYEPPPPCKGAECPTPAPPPIKTPPPPTPAPTPPLLVNIISPNTLYAGSPGFRLEVGGDYFTPDSQINFNQNPLPTTFVSAQRLTAEIPASFITAEGPRQILVRTADGRLYSNQFLLNVQAPPKPTFKYIGMMGRKRFNNDTAYFTDSRPTPFGARLNDVVAGRFRLVDISPEEAIFEDVNLGFRHKVPMEKTPTGGSGSGQPRGFPPSGGFVPFNPGDQPQGIPGIPGSVQPQRPRPTPAPQKPDVDDDGDD